MKVIFLDFDGVLNSSASFLYVKRVRDSLDDAAKAEQGPANEVLCNVCTSNFQYILDKVPDAKIVISSTWRNLFSLEWLQNQLAKYRIDSSRVIDKTPSSFNRSRGYEINSWLEDHPEVTNFVVLDDNHIGEGLEETGKVVSTSWLVGLTLEGAAKAIDLLGGDDSGRDLPL